MVCNAFNQDKAQWCPGGVCEVTPSAAAPKVLRLAQAAVAPAPVDAAEAERCKVPDFAKAIGHEAQWKLHNNCG